MGCCGTATEAPQFVTLAGALTPFVRWRGAAGRPPAVSTVDTSAAPCCDACASRSGPVVVVEKSACALGACGIPMTAGIALPLGRPAAPRARAQAGAVAPPPGVQVPSPATVANTAAMWSALAPRQAGFLSPLTVRPFQRSQPGDLDRLNLEQLHERLAGIPNLPATPEADAEYDLVSRAISEREARGGGGGTLFNEDRPAAPPTPAEWEAKRADVARVTAERLAPGDTPEDRRRRDQIITQAITSTFATFNQWLEGNYQARVEEIHGGTSITLRRLQNEDNEAERRYRLELARINPQLLSGGGGGGGGGGGDSGGGGGGAVAGLGLLGLLAALFR